MAVHVAILKREYLQRILAGAKTVESRLTVRPIPPWGGISPGDRIHFKASSGPFMASARADAVMQADGLTPRRVDELRARFEACVGGDDDYWIAKRRANYATFVSLTDVTASDLGPGLPPSRGPAWFVLTDDDPRAPGWVDVVLTGGALRQGYVRLGADAARLSSRESGDELTLWLPGGQRVATSIRPDGMIRWRGWRQVFEAGGVQAGWRVSLRETARGGYRVHLFPPAKTPEAPSADDGPAMERREIDRPAGDAVPDREAVSRNTMNASLDINLFAPPDERTRLIALAREEDVGPDGVDLTTRALVDPSRRAKAAFVARQPGRVCGLGMLAEIARAYDPELAVDLLARDGDAVEAGQAVARVAGSHASLLTAERVMLNFITHLSGIATLTARFVEAVAGTKAVIVDTRKTIPGLRRLAKYAVRCGGGGNHRIGLYDAMLVKDNHLVDLPDDRLAVALSEAIARARAMAQPPAFIEIEVDRLSQLDAVLELDADIILLDNMSPAEMVEAVARRDARSPGVLLEASGGVSLERVRQIAQTGVDRIAIGALTHSAPALDVGLDACA